MIKDYSARWELHNLSELRYNTGIPVGFTTEIMYSNLNAGWIPLNGNSFFRDTYKELWDFVQKSNNVISEYDWQEMYKKDHYVPYYSDGDGVSTFRVPLLNSDKVDEVIDYGGDGTQWYRQWRSGWLEQGGVAVATASGSRQVINLLRPYKDTNYSVLSTVIHSSTVGAGYKVEATDVAGSITSRTIDKFEFVNTITRNWQTEGFGEPNDKPVRLQVVYSGKAFASNTTFSLEDMLNDVPSVLNSIQRYESYLDPGDKDDNDEDTGWAELFNGFIIMWGKSTTQTITFPIPFKNQCLQIYACGYSFGSQWSIPTVVTATTINEDGTGATLHQFQDQVTQANAWNNGNYGCRWIAIGW